MSDSQKEDNQWQQDIGLMNALQGGVEYGAAGAGVGYLLGNVAAGAAIGGGAIGGGSRCFCGSAESDGIAGTGGTHGAWRDRPCTSKSYYRGRAETTVSCDADATWHRHSPSWLDGLNDSPARLQSNLHAGESDALADALARVSVQNRGMGLDMMSQQANERAQGFGEAASVIGNLYLTDRQQKQKTGRMNANRFGRLERSSMRQVSSKPVLNRGGAGSMTSGNRRSMAVRTT